MSLFAAMEMYRVARKTSSNIDKFLKLLWLARLTVNFQYNDY